MLTDIEQFPFRGLGKRLQGGAVGLADVKMVSSGLVGTAYGLRGFSATRSATGIYDLAFERSVDVDITPKTYISAGSGPAPFEAKVDQINATSGTAKLYTYRFSPTATASGAVNMVNPPTGAAVRLTFINQPFEAF